MKFQIHIAQDEEGGFVASCPTLPGCWSQGDTRDEAVRNITEAIEAYLESLDRSGDPIPLPISEEVIEVNIPKRRVG